MGSISWDSMPVGFRFHPNDEELIAHYLKLKMHGLDSCVQGVISEVDVCKFEPWDLPALSAVKSDDQEWFFFCPRDYKYSNSKRLNRATKTGYWKVTGKERLIKARATKAIIGKKRTLVFHRGRNPGVRTNWVMHECCSVETFPNQRHFVICRLKKKCDEKIVDDGEPSSQTVPVSGNEEIRHPIPEVNDPIDVDIESLLLPSQPQPQLQDEFPALESLMNIEQPSDSPFPNGTIIASNELLFSNETSEPEEDPTEFLNSVLLDSDEIYFQGHCLVNSHPFMFPADEIHELDPHESRRSVSSFLDQPTHNQFSMQNTSSVSLTEDVPQARICRISLENPNIKPQRPKSTERTKGPARPNKAHWEPRSIEMIKRGVSSKRIQLKREGLPEAVSGSKAREASAQNTAADLLQKEKLDADKSAASDGSPGINWKSFFVFVDTPCQSSPPSVYFFNAVIGVLLFAVFLREAFFVR